MSKAKAVQHEIKVQHRGEVMRLYQVIARVGITGLCALTLTGVLAHAAMASCGHRPGTPDLLTAESTVKGGVNLSWRVLQTEGGRYVDIEVTDSTGRIVQSIAGMDVAQSGNRTPYGQRASWVTVFNPGKEYCFRVKARSGPGTQGCLSVIWSNKACVTTLAETPPTPAGTNSTPSPRTSAPPSPPPPQCNLSAKLVVGQCLNIDGTPSTIFQPGSRSVFGCGATKDEATEAAKKAIYASNVCLYEGDPMPGCCSYTIELVSPGCFCTRITTRNYGSCGGNTPVGTWPFCCPSNSHYSGGVCRKTNCTKYGTPDCPYPPLGGWDGANIDRPGGDYTSFDLNGTYPSDCRDACAKDGKCQAWTYVRPGVQGPKARCWLKSTVPAPVNNTCCISEIMESTDLKVH